MVRQAQVKNRKGSPNMCTNPTGGRQESKSNTAGKFQGHEAKSKITRKSLLLVFFPL